MLRRTFLVLISLLLIVSVVGAQTEQPVKSSDEANGDNIGKPEEKMLIDFENLPQDLSIEKWRIKLSGYSDNAFSRQASILKIVDVDSGKLSTDLKFSKCLGIRVYFEYSHGNDWAQIKPVIPINTFYAKEGGGILRNVGPIRSISLWVSGRNYKNSIEVRMVDPSGNFKSVNFGSLFFRGWRKLTWVNPDYIKNVKKRDIIKTHLYPRYSPFLKFDSIVVYKSHQESGGDFVTYIKDVRIEYEPALKAIDEAVDDEGIWRIQETKAIETKEKEDKFYDLYFSGSSYEEQYLKDKAKDKAVIKERSGPATE
ncbi:MAG: flagellar filament outer layer protein FlaA [Spirochaetes bacterium]|nr:flagellar filament outer layer protein FlaA [Spirochaetota bacterium]